jgi:DNA topoisomerase I
MGILNWIRNRWGSAPQEIEMEVVVEDTTKVEEPVEVVVEVKEEAPKPKRKYKKRATTKKPAAKKPAAKKPAAKKPAAKKPAAKKVKK